ncbi:exported hypothetical protein [Candidatus Sulfotelmatomonas gaucii]|uniref:DUF3300 domain-containing protein n=1 Tax=Candidatus Sulfuritelmatomonas gaucii TaxID=2043161 RepID=A0A2N9L850_9BACT|nr:exported hypothetical protein [Candidatus Sulfotelmatomonas gaucii]
MMEAPMSFTSSCFAGFAPLLMNTTRSSFTRTNRFWLTPTVVISRASLSKLAAVATLFALAGAPLCLMAQQGYPPQPYGAYGSPSGNSYAQPAPQSGSGQPQYQQPQYGYAQPQYSAPQQPYAQQPYSQEQQYAPSPYGQQQDLASQPSAAAQALSPDQLEQMLAPVALYPDSLLAQILAASTYPAEVAVADQWLHQMQSQGYGSPDQIAGGANAQTSWDPSVKALTAFPDVLDMLNHNLEWTTSLGNAYYNQPDDVMQTVQVLRQRAEQAGNLQSTPQEDVSNDQGYIDVAPPNPEQVYVPTYNPWDVYGQPISPYPGFSLMGALGDFFGSSPVQYGLSFALGAFGRFPFGWLGWGLDWLANSVLFDHADYYTHSNTVADWGLPHGGPRAYGWGGGDRWHGGYDRAYGSQRGFDQRGFDHRGFDQRGPDQRGYDQRGGWADNRNPGNRNPGQSYVRPAIGAPYNPRGEAFNRGGNDNNRGSGEFNRGYQPNGNGYTHPEMPARQMYSRAESQPVYSNRQAYQNRAPAWPTKIARPPTQAGRRPSAIRATATRTADRSRLTPRVPASPMPARNRTIARRSLTRSRTLRTVPRAALTVVMATHSPEANNTPAVSISSVTRRSRVVSPKVKRRSFPTAADILRIASADSVGATRRIALVAAAIPHTALAAATGRAIPAAAVVITTKSAVRFNKKCNSYPFAPKWRRAWGDSPKIQIE